MNNVEYASYPVKVRTAFSFDRNNLIDGILKHACTRRKSWPSGDTLLCFRDAHREYTEDALRAELGRLNRATLVVVMAAFMRNTESREHGFVTRSVRCYVESADRSKNAAEAVLYYASRLSNVLITFSAPQDKLYERCIATAADVASSARMFQSVDDREFRSGSFFAERSMKGIAAWYCLGKDKIVDAETLDYLSRNLDVLASHANEIHKQKFYSVETLSELVERTRAALEEELQISSS